MGAGPHRRERIGWVDYARGIAILSVVVWHVAGGLISNPSIVVNGSVELLHGNWEIYALRGMPIFFFLSGSFVVHSLRKPTAEFLENKARSLLYPYVVWSLITLVLGTVASSYANHEMSLRDAPEMLYNPVQHYWFLYALMVIMLLFLAFDRFGINPWLFLAFGLAIYVLGDITDLSEVHYVSGQIGLFTVFFAAGVICGEPVLERVAAARTGLLLAAALVLVTASGLFLVNAVDPELTWMKGISATIVLATIATISELFDRVGVLREIRRWGRMSLEIYLVHVIALAAARAILLRLFEVENLWAHLAFGTFVGLYGPILMVLVLRRIHFPYAFTLPRRVRLGEAVQS